MHTPDFSSLTVAYESVASKCINCGRCRNLCDFLKEYGSPREIADRVGNSLIEEWPDPFECSLCGLCGAVCRDDVRADKLFLSMRRERVRQGKVDFKRYMPILAYEQIGSSKLFSLSRLPIGGDTVLFPGCTLPSTRPDVVRQLFSVLESYVPDLGIVLGCCFKPSYDLGRSEYYDDRFSELYESLLELGVRRIITTCPNCQKVFTKYGATIETVTAYEVLSENGYRPENGVHFKAIVHDPCPQRYDEKAQLAVRTLAERCGVAVVPRKEEGQLTRCCGEGGMVKFVRPELADSWTQQCVEFAKGSRVVTSCAGCTGFLGESLEVDHILDLLLASKAKKALRTPFNYIARLKLKWWFKRILG